MAGEGATCGRSENKCGSNMDNDISFGLTDQDLKNQKTKTIFLTIRNFFEMVGPTVIRWINVIIYHIIKFIRAFVVSVIRMILGKEV